MGRAVIGRFYSGGDLSGVPGVHPLLLPPSRGASLLSGRSRRLELLALLFITAVPTIKLFARGEGDRGGHVL
jgi:hypothetical protein